MSKWQSAFLTVAAIGAMFPLTQARAAIERPANVPNVYAFSTIRCEVRDGASNQRRVVELQPTTVAKISGNSERLGDQKRLTLPDSRVSLIFLSTAVENGRDRHDVLRFREVLHVSSLELTNSSGEDVFMKTVQIDAIPDRNYHFQIPKKDVSITCSKSIELVDTNAALRHVAER